MKISTFHKSANETRRRDDKGHQQRPVVCIKCKQNKLAHCSACAEGHAKCGSPSQCWIRKWDPPVTSVRIQMLTIAMRVAISVFVRQFLPGPKNMVGAAAQKKTFCFKPDTNKNKTVKRPLFVVSVCRFSRSCQFSCF